MDTDTRATYRPYAPPSNVTDLLKRLRSRNLPERIDATYLRAAGVPEGSVARTIAALEFLGLIEGQAPTAALRTMATSTDEEYQHLLGQLLRTAYSDVFEIVDPEHDSQQRIRSVFMRYTPASQRERMVVFFLGLCRAAGIPTLDTPRQRGSSVSTNSSGKGAGRNTVSGRSGVTKHATGQRGPGPTQLRSDAADTIAPALIGLMHSLPPAGTPLSESRRNQWLAMAKATLAFVYPNEEEGGATTNEDEVEE